MPERDFSPLPRTAALVAGAAYARKLRTVTVIGDADIVPLLGAAMQVWTAEPGSVEWGQVAVITGVDVLPDPAGLLCSADVDVLACSATWGGLYGFDTFRALVEQAGFEILRHEAVGPYQVVLAARTTPAAALAPATDGRNWDVPRYAIIPTHSRPELLTALVASLGRQCDRIVVLDNASEPPVDEEHLQSAAGVPVLVLRDEEQPPHLSRYWNVMLDAVAEWAGTDVYDVAILNDDSIVPAGWYDACATALRKHETAVIAHTTPTTPALLTDLHLDPNNRMTPHAFVVRGEVGLRADESMRWWYFDDDLSWQARLAGGVLSVAGPRVVNARANSTTVGPLAEQAAKDQAAFAAKWSR